MKWHFALLLAGLNLSLQAENSFRLKNTNFTISQGSFIPLQDNRYLYNYNRLRLYGDYTDKNYFIHATADTINYRSKEFTDSDSFTYLKHLHSDTPFHTQTSFYHYSKGAASAKLYRFYGGFQDSNNRIVAGLQNITIGVGHIWTPSNLFNPKNSYALEPDETFGVLALSYTRYIGVESQVYGVVSQKKDKSFKYAAGLQTTMGITDIGLNSIYSNKTKMLGYTLQGDLGSTGIEIRSEGAFINGKLSTPLGQNKNKNFFQGIIGADYAFIQGVNLTIEAFYSSKKFTYQEVIANSNSELTNNLTLSHFYLGTTLDYNFTMYLSGSLLYIKSFNKQNSQFISSSLSYTINDNNTITIGTQLYGGSNNSEFGMWNNSCYLKYILSY